MGGLQALDGIVLCAGINEFVPVKFVKLEKIEKMFQTNYFSQLILVQMLLKKKGVKVLTDAMVKEIVRQVCAEV